MTNFRPIFENDWCGIEVFLKDVLSPVFGEYEQGYDILTNDSDVREKAKNANILKGESFNNMDSKYNEQVKNKIINWLNGLAGVYNIE